MNLERTVAAFVGQSQFTSDRWLEPVKLDVQLLSGNLEYTCDYCVLSLCEDLCMTVV